MFPHLSSWRVNLTLLQEAANKDLLSILDKCEGTKVTAKITICLKFVAYHFLDVTILGNRVG